MEGMNKKELLEKAKAAKSPEEIQVLAKENGMEDFSVDSAKAYYEQFHKEGELLDEELDNVAGGACYIDDGRMVTTVFNDCKYFACKHCGSTDRKIPYGHYSGCPFAKMSPLSEQLQTDDELSGCSNCKYMSYEKGLWLCNKPNNRR